MDNSLVAFIIVFSALVLTVLGFFIYELAKQKSKCKNVDCGTYGVCDSATGKCVCEGNYIADRCDVPQPLPSPTGKCSGVDCGAHGACDSTKGKCECRDGYTGDRCDVPPTGKCSGVNCGANGTCDGTTGKCICKNGYTGTVCEISPPSPQPPKPCTVGGTECNKGQGEFCDPTALVCKTAESIGLIRDAIYLQEGGGSSVITNVKPSTALACKRACLTNPDCKGLTLIPSNDDCYLMKAGDWWRTVTNPNPAAPRYAWVKP